MAETNQDNSPDKDDADFDDELDSLSADEKAAFDKIMAEISAATGEPTSDNDESKAEKAKPHAMEDTPAPESTNPSDLETDSEPSAEESSEKLSADMAGDNEPEPVPESNGSEEDEDGLNDEQQAALDAIMQEIDGKNASSSVSASESVEKSEIEAEAKEPIEEELPASEGDQADEALSDDQQQALDNIMAEINSKSEGGDQESEPTPEEPKSDEEALSDDQQQALDSIMAEINSKRESDGEEKEPAVEQEPDDEALSDDQQQALDSIMAEINSKRKGDVEEKEPAVEQEPDDEALSDDQQQALDSIMAEINSKRKGDVEEKEPADEQEPDDDALSDDQQQALDSIMAEINSKRKSDDDGKEPAAELDESDEKQDAPESNNLTIEEFDDELNSLLTEAEQGAQNKATPAAETPVESTAFKDQTTGPQKEEKKEYPILQEVVVAEEKPGPKKGKRVRGVFWAGRKKALLTGTLAACLVFAGGYYAYNYYLIKGSTPPVLSDDRDMDQPSLQSSAKGTAPSLSEERIDKPSPVEIDEPPQSEPLIAENAVEDGLSALNFRLSSAREQIQAKINDINQLKSYYARGIAEETEKIEQALEQGRIPTFTEAINNKSIELALRAIQRRRTYIAKLGTPISQLTSMAEELLYLERKSDIFETLSRGINGLQIEAFEQEALTIVTGHLQYNAQLSIDQVEATPVKLQAIWDDIAQEISKKSNLLAQRAPLNRAISREICKGNYDRKYQLTALSAETAVCLVRWPGKDLYLNALNELTPEVAKVLSQWPGEWISLNGIKELPAASAKHLAAWPGRRLSLNGLTQLSSEATSHLSQWGGEQLEMVGLHSIGSWENYGTRLFLSEKLRRQLEAQ